MGFIDSIKSAVKERSAGAKAEREQEERDKIFNDAKFIESLDTHPNVDVNSDFETLRQAHEAFRLKDKASSDLQKLFRDQLKYDLGLDLDAPEMAQVKTEIETYLQGEMIDHPEHIKQLSEQLQEFNEQQAKIKEQEKILKGLGGDLDRLKKKKGAIKEILGSGRLFEGWRGPSAKKLDKQRKAERDFGVDVNRLDEELDNVSEKIHKGEMAEDELERLRDEFKDLRKKILQDLAPMATLAEMARTKAKEKFQVMADLMNPANNTIAHIEKARAFLEKMKGTDYDQATGFDYMSADIDEATVSDLFDSRLELLLQDEVKKAVDKITGTNTTLRNMVRGLKPFMDRGELGTKGRQETREFLVNYLANELLPTLPKGKQILLTKTLEYYA